MIPIVQISTTKLNQILDRAYLRLLPDRHPTVHDLNSTSHDSLMTPSRLHPDNKMNTYSIIPINSRSLHDLYSTS